MPDPRRARGSGRPANAAGGPGCPVQLAIDRCGTDLILAVNGYAG
jgi:hypothetical protein